MKRFKKDNKKKKVIISILVITLVGLVVLIQSSYAFFQKQTEVTFISAKVGDFRVSLSNITATSTNNSVNLSYTATGYNASTTCGLGTTKGNYNIGATSVNNNNCTKTGLNQNTTYYYKVCTKNKLNQESCKEGSINTKYNAPTLSNITATSTTNSIDLSYTESGTVSTRTCKYSTTNGSYTTNGNSQTSTKCSITGLTQGVTYYYQICVSNNGGQNCKTGNTATKLNPPILSNITSTSTYNSINLSYTMSGTVSTRTCKYGTSNGNYTNSVSNPSNTGCSITGLAENTTFYYQVCGSNSGGQNCKTGSIATKKKTIADEVNIGDYISMTPTLTSYKIATTKTGYSSAQTINPSELNLWRVIKKNSDGTVDMVSHNLSSKEVYFKGKTGYINYIGTLNEIAASYTNSNYVYKTRSVGYNGQEEILTDTSVLSQTTRPWPKHNREYYNWRDCAGNYLCGEYELQGGGDIKFLEDMNLLINIYGDKVFEGYDSENTFWLASRNYDWYSGGWCFDGNVVRLFKVNGDGLYCREGSKQISQAKKSRIRPILTIKSTVKVAGGNGTESLPYGLGNS